MVASRGQHAVVAVPGGLVALAGSLIIIDGRVEAEPDELFDEESGRWFPLPSEMQLLRKVAYAVALPP
jgi:hypothetical protein